jgi:hypothetical protein
MQQQGTARPIDTMIIGTMTINAVLIRNIPDCRANDEFLSSNNSDAAIKSYILCEIVQDKYIG